MINCLLHSNAKKELGNSLIPDAEEHFAALLLSEFKNRYVKANINL